MVCNVTAEAGIMTPRLLLLTTIQYVTAAVTHRLQAFWTHEIMGSTCIRATEAPGPPWVLDIDITAC